jgi:hypothetical protein
MRIFIMMVIVGVVSGVGCTAENRESNRTDLVSRVDSSAAQEMIAAAIAGDPAQMARALADVSAVCHPGGGCSPEFASCTIWSPSVGCGEPHCGQFDNQCFFNTGTDPRGKPTFIRYPRTLSTSESYRVCSTPDRRTCTEFMQTTSSWTCDAAACCPACNGEN